VRGAVAVAWLWLVLSGAGGGATGVAEGSVTSAGDDPMYASARGAVTPSAHVDDQGRDADGDRASPDGAQRAALNDDAPAAFIAASATDAAETVLTIGPRSDAPQMPYPACPDGMALVGRACIDRWEAHLVARDAGSEPTLWPHAKRPERGVRYEARTAAGVFPQGYISRNEADVACRNAGKRLCTLSEWRSACEGSRRGLYPYGKKLTRGSCNSAKPHLLEKHFGRSAALWKYDEHFNNPLLNQIEGWLARTGEYERCVSDAGVYDMVGNLHEWVADTVDHRFKARLDAEEVPRRKQWWRTGNGAFLGGFFSTHTQLGPGCRFTTIAHEPAYHDYSTGFRCCARPAGVDAPPEPATPRKAKRRK
jgi:hypothetical protein